jgi:hypothetical protein
MEIDLTLRALLLLLLGKRSFHMQHRHTLEREVYVVVH